jgi:hypothetical protein
VEIEENRTAQITCLESVMTLSLPSHMSPLDKREEHLEGNASGRVSAPLLIPLTNDLE